MKNQTYRFIAIFAIFFGLAVAGVQGQTPARIEVNVPFDFSVGKATLKSGVYSIKRMSGSLLSFSNSDGKSVIFNAPVTLSSADEKAVERLVFNKYGDQYFLAQIWLSADSGREVLRETKAKKPERVEIALRTRR